MDSKDLQHSAAILAAILTLLASFKQHGHARAKATKHSCLLREELSVRQRDDIPPPKTDESTLVKVLRHDVDHFKKVGFWWLIVFLGALIAVLAEALDWGLDHHLSFLLF